MMEVKQIEYKTDGDIIEDEYRIGESDFEVLRRIWVTSDGHFIREFTTDEYINHNPSYAKVLSYSIGSDRKIDIVAYCREYRKYYGKKRGAKAIAFVKYHDYINCPNFVGGV